MLSWLANPLCGRSRRYTPFHSRYISDGTRLRLGRFGSSGPWWHAVGTISMARVCQQRERPAVLAPSDTVLAVRRRPQTASPPELLVQFLFREVLLPHCRFKGYNAIKYLIPDTFLRSRSFVSDGVWACLVRLLASSRRLAMKQMAGATHAETSFWHKPAGAVRSCCKFNDHFNIAARKVK